MMAITVLGTIYSPHRVLENIQPQYSNWRSSKYPMQLCKLEWILSSQCHCSVINNATLLCLKIYYYTLWTYRDKRNITELAVPWEPEKNGGKTRSRDSRMLLTSVLHFCCNDTMPVRVTQVIITHCLRLHPAHVAYPMLSITKSIVMGQNMFSWWLLLAGHA